MTRGSHAMNLGWYSTLALDTTFYKTSIDHACKFRPLKMTNGKLFA